VGYVNAGTVVYKIHRFTLYMTNTATKAQRVEEKSGQFEFHEIDCSACGSKKWKFAGFRGGEAHRDGTGVRVRIVRCLDCTHLFPQPMPVPVNGLDDLYTDEDEYFHGHDVEKKIENGKALLQRLEKRLGRKGSILDVGCGRGEGLAAARDSGWEYQGIDPSASFLEWGHKHLGVKGLQGTLDQVSFPQDHFDVVTLGGIIEHLYNPYETLKEISRILKPGGILVLDAPNEDALYSVIGNVYLRLLGKDWVINMAPTFPPYHVQGFNPRSLTELIKRAGFKVDKLTILGSVCPFTGVPTLRKKLEYSVAKAVNWVGNKTGSGIYMELWARKL
jgi:2-polyprenyl-3-methyl-5-hydroxy-6-metoxy-1,4-benzoquinol methylase